MADWVEPDDDFLIKCPYCVSKAAKRRFLLHLTNCSKKQIALINENESNKANDVIVCPFNRQHHILNTNNEWDKHQLRCPDLKNMLRRTRSQKESSTMMDKLPAIETLSLEESVATNPEAWMRPTAIDVQSGQPTEMKSLAPYIEGIKENPKKPLDSEMLNTLTFENRAYLVNYRNGLLKRNNAHGW